MGLGTGFINSTSQADLIPELWSATVNRFYRENSSVRNAATDWSDDFAGGGDTLNIPSLSAIASQTVTEGAALTMTDVTESDVSLVINTHKAVAFQVPKTVAAKVKTVYRMIDKRMEDAGYTAGAELETAITGLFTTFTQAAGSTGTDVDDEAIRLAISTLRANNVSMNNLVFVFHPTVLWTVIQGMDRFSSVDYTSASDTVNAGVVGKLYNIPIIESTFVNDDGTDYINALVGKDAIAYAVADMGSGNAVNVEADYALEYLSTVVVADIFFGVIVNRNLAGVKILSQS